MSEAATVEAPAVVKPSDAGKPAGNPNDFASKYGQTTPHKPNLVRDRQERGQIPKLEKQADAPIIPTEQTTTEVTDDFDPSQVLAEATENGEKKLGHYKQQQLKQKELEAQNQELAKKLEKYEKEDVPSLQMKISELEKLSQDSDSKKETERLQKEIESVKTILEQKDSELSEKTKRLQFFDLQSDPLFKRDFEHPVNQAFGRAAMAIGNNSSLMGELQKAFSAAQIHHKTADPQEKGRQYQLAMEIANGIAEQLSPMQQNQFNGAFWDTFAAVGKYAERLANHEQTWKEYQELEARTRNEQVFQSKQRWSTAYKDNASRIAEDTKYPEDVARIIAVNKINDLTSEDDAIALGALDPEDNTLAPEQIARVLAQGAAHNRLKAHNQALRMQIKELEETLGKFRTSGTAGSVAAGPSTNQQQEVKEKTPQTFEQKWRASLANK